MLVRLTISRIAVLDGAISPVTYLTRFMWAFSTTSNHAGIICMSFTLGKKSYIACQAKQKRITWLLLARHIRQLLNWEVSSSEESSINTIRSINKNTSYKCIFYILYFIYYIVTYCDDFSIEFRTKPVSRGLSVKQRVHHLHTNTLQHLQWYQCYYKACITNITNRDIGYSQLALLQDRQIGTTISIWWGCELVWLDWRTESTLSA